MRLGDISPITFRIVQGDVVTFNLTVTSLGSPFNLSGYTPKLVMKLSIDDASVLVTTIGSVLSASAGTATITMTAANTNQTEGSYIAEFKITNGTDVKTLSQFQIDIVKAVSTT